MDINEYFKTRISRQSFLQRSKYGHISILPWRLYYDFQTYLFLLAAFVIMIIVSIT